MSCLKKNILLFLSITFLAIFFSGCISKEKKNGLFEILESNKTGLDFSNNLTPTDSFNLFQYMYFYNGAGIGTGDFNNDGLIDLFFSSNQGKNKLYLNTGNLHFKDVTTEAGIPEDGGWSTGVSVVDINNDGLLDIYICRVGKFKTLNSHNEFLICKGIDKNGIPQYEEKSREYGLDFSGFSTQGVFFDYDMDGDLDFFLLNHSMHQNSNFRPRDNFLNTYSELSGDKMYRNDGNKFTDVTKESGINSSVLSYGLGVVVADINLDGYPDIYVSNDFHENDYLYINQHNGTFKDEMGSRMMHTSQFSMGTDAADINNDGYPDIISTDMLPDNAYILKRSQVENDYDIFYKKIDYGYSYQYARNSLQLNRRNGLFSEVGLYAGIAATDWSWGPLWVDFDNDGLKDLFISNGIPKRMNDIDFINYISNIEVQNKIRNDKINQTDMSLIDKFPKIKIPNKFFKNTGSSSFTDIADSIGNQQSTYSNGGVYADFDNDGDLDIVVNNIDDPVLFYQNKSNDSSQQRFLEVKLTGPAQNRNAIGSKLIAFSKGAVQLSEKFPVRGFQSSMEIPMHLGIGSNLLDSIFLVWPDNTYQAITVSAGQSRLTLTYKKGLPLFDYNKLVSFFKNETGQARDITAGTGLLFRHKENPFAEFDREPLIPRMISTEGPALAIADINQDGLEDVFIGSAKGERSAVFLQNSLGKFSKIIQPVIEADSVFEDVAACWADVNNDGNIDLVVASGGNENAGRNEYMQPRVYLGDGKAGFKKSVNAFTDIYVNASSVAASDFNGDGYVDLFIGGRSVPEQYGEVPRSYLLLNNGKGEFGDVTSSLSDGLAHEGFVTQAQWYDIDKDGDKDLLICCEWGGIDVFINNKGKFVKRELTSEKGWWNFVLPCDVDGDGDIDLLAGNQGLNSRLKASDKEPVRLYVNDFDNNGKREPVLTYYLNGKELPFSNKADLEKQLPFLKKKFLYAEDFAKASMEELFSKEKLAEAKVFTADYFDNAVLINNGNLNFSIHALPWEAQLSAYKDALPVQVNKGGLPEILLFGNYYENSIEMGRYDADFGSVLVSTGNGNFNYSTLNGLTVKGQVRHIGKITIQGKESFILAKNNDSLMVIRFNKNE